MKKMLQLAALVAVMGLTLWPAAGNAAKYARCSVLHGGACAPTGQQVWCSLTGDGYPENRCVCASGHWDCGCDTGLFECW